MYLQIAFISRKVKTEPVNGSTIVNNNGHLEEDMKLARSPLNGGKHLLGLYQKKLAF